MPIVGIISPAAVRAPGFPEYDALARLAPAPAASPAADTAGQASPASAANGAAAIDFGVLLEKAVNAVNDRQQAATEATRAVLLGESDKLHQSVIAAQEASVAFSLMVEVRNKVVEGYQELMRMSI
ncbi:flagellar hook-basal body complex protein FliE [Opitutaceae bacterium TAV1]|nr:flagellar hook-basal body protein [Opitutaceae bacterium TAV5]EIQ00374.1 flagellar hook-basal body complex protein FliE [Opitutaceae bacterium TAV1]